MFKSVIISAVLAVVLIGRKTTTTVDAKATTTTTVDPKATNLGPLETTSADQNDYKIYASGKPGLILGVCIDRILSFRP